MRNVLPLVVTFVVTAAIASVARADGVVYIEDGGLQGIATPSGFRYVVVEERDHSILERIGPSGRIVAVRVFPGRFTIAAVARDRATSGLSADRKTLVLVNTRYGLPRASTRFLILSLPGLFVRSAPTLMGDFSFDAISPDGSLLYFIQHTSRRDTTRYAVRAFDRASGTLLPGAIVDRTEPDEIMRGNPLSRVTSPDGRWAYTLYDGGGKTPFVHALDTVGRRARCIDLDALAGRQDLLSLRLRRGSVGAIFVVAQGKRILSIETRAFHVTGPSAASSASKTGLPWAPIGGAIAALVAGSLVSIFLVRRRRLATT